MNPKLAKWEERLYEILREIDVKLEDKYGARWPLHPARLRRGAAANPQYDGLFRITASFSAGYGSKHGPGYIFRVEIVTLSEVPVKIKEAIEAEAAVLLEKGLLEAFPGRSMSVDRDGAVYKIFGDLSIDAPDL